MNDYDRALQEAEHITRQARRLTIAAAVLLVIIIVVLAGAMR